MNDKPSPLDDPCSRSLAGVRSALFVLNGKWKLPLIVALSSGPKRFKEIQRTLQEITPKILSRELKELESNEFVERHVCPSSPMSVTYRLTPYSRSLDRVITELSNWGEQHCKHLRGDCSKNKKVPNYGL